MKDKLNSKLDSKEKSTIKELVHEDYFKGSVKVLRKARPGPFILIVTDGYASVEAVSNDCDFNVGDVIDLEGTVEERSGKLQIRIKRMTKSEMDFDKIIEQEPEDGVSPNEQGQLPPDGLHEPAVHGYKCG